MKKLLLSAAILFGSLGAFAQGGLGYGLRAGVNIPKYSMENGSSESNTGFFVTGYLDAPVSPYFSIQPGLSLQNKGGKWSETNNNNSIAVKQSIMSLDIPVNLVAKLPTGGSGNFFIGAGPYVGFALSGKNKFEGNLGDSGLKTEEDVKFGSGDGDELKRTDFGVNFLAGYQLTNGFQINAGYGLGLTNLAPNSNFTTKNRVWSIGIGFGL
ncbi:MULTISPECIES: porin family protein [Sphingobacterium]|uniref:Outer membrane protein with beta-barrel domain n=2 Tax=Sphingobacterium TaxID=28453 RepID=A0A420ADT6_SPHD1|nr:MULTISPECIES: porin family protein [Sphingobacterium]RKE42688.1 outer membrane protein with beta-barrel domain [Sphingobacterium detergens]ULT22704.1 PorT family protein [Sphingobacterium sp. E70]